MSVTEYVSFLRERAQVERQCGTNQLLCGNEAGNWRISRGNQFDQCADGYAIMACTIANLETEIVNLKNKLNK